MTTRGQNVKTRLKVGQNRSSESTGEIGIYYPVVVKSQLGESGQRGHNRKTRTRSVPYIAHSPIRLRPAITRKCLKKN